MSDRLAADLVLRPPGDDGFAGVLYHLGDSGSPLKLWAALIRSEAPGGWAAVQKYAGRVMELLADPRVLFTAATALRAAGPKAPGPNGLRLEALDRNELRGMCAALGKAIAAGTYRPGPERVVWAAKASGRGRRPIVISNVQDRVVQKALALVLGPVLDGRFDPLSFAYRPARDREHGLAAAGVFARTHPIWLTHDVRDAFGRVPLGRLLDVASKWLPCRRLRDFLKLVLPPQARSLGGIKQGGPLSPLMLEVYLTHTLHEPWRRAGHAAHVLGYADDLLVAAGDAEAAKSADGALRALLTPRRHAAEGAVRGGRRRHPGVRRRVARVPRAARGEGARSGARRPRSTGSAGASCSPTPSADPPSGPAKSSGTGSANWGRASPARTARR